MSVKVLFIGGTGIISSACSPLALEKGFDLYLLNRGKSSRPIPAGATVLHGDIREPDSVKAAIDGHDFDVVVDWIAFTPEHIETDIELFRGRTKQFVFISSASAYQTPPAFVPVTESTVLSNPYWGYSRNKIACEERLVKAYREEGFPITIVRPSHTYDERSLPMQGGWTVIDRMRKGEPVIVHGDGTSLWTLTHHKDFAKGFVGLLGNYQTIGDAFHITSDETVTWDAIHQVFAAAAGAPPPKIVHVPSDVIAAYDSGWGAGLLGDKTHSMVFDNSKIKRYVPEFRCTTPFSLGAKEIVAWYSAAPERRKINDDFNTLTDTIIAAQRRVFPV